MATIPLREYCREIENMLEKGRTEEPVAHCRHILKHFPKHIETYRLLGKAYLESRQLGDAADIFQRVLSSIPEDFVSHIGMSIIREDEGNLDAALWHMERAFEVQSSNIAIQDELRRLYEHRDGQEPPKIRLTRGALAHMYAHGHLYSQAIAELRAALATDPKRLDLQVLLAKMYHAEKQQANAAKTASQLITKLPYCLAANQILAEILTSSQRASEAAPHRARVQELDPYFKHVSAQYPTLEGVPSGLIVLETLDWEATKGGLISQPAWATSIGVDISNASAGEELPEWLAPAGGRRERSAAFGEISFDDNLTAFASAASEGGFDQQPPQISEPSLENNQNEATTMQEEDDTIPDWMKTAGWGQRDPNTPEEPPTSLFDDDEEETTEEGGIAKASIPDWLKAMAPSDVPETDEGAAEPASSADLPDWLQGFNAGETVPSRVAPSSQANVPSWMTTATGTSKKNLPHEDSEPALPDWLGGDTSPASSEPELPSLEQADMPDWLKDMGGPPASSQEETEAPDWLGGQGSAATELTDFGPDDLEESTAPEWLQEISNEVVRSTGPLKEPKEVEQDIPDWLSEESPEASTKPESATSTSDVATSTSDETALADLFAESQEESSPVTSSWLDELDETEGEDPSLRSGVTDWLSKKEQDAEGLADAVPAAEVPDWLRDLGLEEPEPELPGTGELFQTDRLVPPAGMEDLGDTVEMADLGKDAVQDLGLEDDAMAWLESLAAKQGAKEEELLIKPEDRQETSLPTWLQEIGDEYIGDVPTDELPVSVEEEEMVPDWLRGMAEESVAQIPDERDEFDFGTEESLAMAATSTSEEEGEPLSLEGFDMSATEESGTDEGMTAVENEDAAMAWLEALAAKQGAKEEELLTAPAERSEDVPEWLQGILDAEPSIPETESEHKFTADEIAAPLPDSELPDLFDQEEEFEPGEMVGEEGFDLDIEPAVFEAPMEELVLDEEPTLDEDAALAWLESLAAKHGVNEEELLTAVETRPEETPDWVRTVAEKAQAEEDAAAALEMEAPEEIDFLAELVEEQPAAMAMDISEEEESLEPAQMEESTSWLSDLLKDEEEAAPPVSDEVPDWLTDSAADFIATAQVGTMAEEDAEPAMDELTPEEETAMPAWLLAEEEPTEPEAEMAVYPPSSSPVPSWILEETTEESATSTSVETAAQEPEVPSWFLEEEAVEETPLPIFQMEQPVDIETEENRAPIMEAEAEPEPVSEMPLDGLNQARTTLASGDVTAAAEYYEKLIKRNQNVDEAIADITEALDMRYPVDIGLWQVLGDAYVKKSQLQDALDSYTKAEELLR